MASPTKIVHGLLATLQPSGKAKPYYTPQEGLVELQGNIMFYLIIILLGVGWILTSVIRNNASSRSPISHKYLNHGIDVPVHNNSNSISPLPIGGGRIKVLIRFVLNSVISKRALLTGDMQFPVFKLLYSGILGFIERNLISGMH